MNYVYILESESDRSKYTGVTQDLQRRLAQHNNGGAKYSKSKMPYRLIWYAAFVSKEKAYDFEKYLKSSSGHAFRNKRLI
jgi:putative endonuclease